MATEKELEPKTIGERLWSLKENKNEDLPHDIIFSLGGEIISCHKFVLAIASTVFQKMLFGPMKTKLELIEISDVEPQGFKNLIRFVYLRKSDFITLEDAVSTMYAADKYDIPELVRDCSTLLRSDLTFANVVTSFQAAKAMNAGDLQEKAKMFLLDNFEELMCGDEFLEFTEENLSDCIKSDDLIMESELSLFFAVCRWAKSKCTDLHLEVIPVNMASILKTVVTHIRFELMEMEEFTRCVQPTGILPDKEVIRILGHFCLLTLERNDLTATIPVRSLRRRLEFTIMLCHRHDAQRLCSVAWPITSQFSDKFILTTESKRSVFLSAVGFAGPTTIAAQEIRLILEIGEGQKHQASYKILFTITAHFLLRAQKVAFVELAKPIKISPGAIYKIYVAAKKGDLCAREFKDDNLNIEDGTGCKYALTYIRNSGVINALKFSVKRFDCTNALE